MRMSISHLQDGFWLISSLIPIPSTTMQHFPTAPKTSEIIKAMTHLRNVTNSRGKSKGAPGLESRTGRRLVSPATGGEKKKVTHYILGSERRFGCT